MPFFVIIFTSFFRICVSVCYFRVNCQPSFVNILQLLLYSTVDLTQWKRQKMKKKTGKKWKKKRAAVVICRISRISFVSAPANIPQLISWHTWISIVGSGIQLKACICIFYVASTAVVVIAVASFRGMSVCVFSSRVCLCLSLFEMHISIFTNKFHLQTSTHYCGKWQGISNSASGAKQRHGIYRCSAHRPCVQVWCSCAEMICHLCKIFDTSWVDVFTFYFCLFFFVFGFCSLFSGCAFFSCSK